MPPRLVETRLGPDVPGNLTRMRNHVVWLLVLAGASSAALPGCSARDLADRRAEADREIVLRPEVPFDAAAAAAALEPGTAAIDGVAYHKLKKSPIQLFNVKTLFAEDEEVVLRPATPHVLAWLRLRDRKHDDRTRVELAEAAKPLRRTTRTDAYGRFRFEGLKPGRYHLQSEVTWSEVVSQRVPVGSVENGWGVPRTVYRNQASAVYHTEPLSRLVEVAEEGEVVEVDLRG